MCVCLPAASRCVTCRRAGWPEAVRSEVVEVKGAWPVTIRRADSSSWLWLEVKRDNQQSDSRSQQVLNRWVWLPAAAAVGCAATPGDAVSAGSSPTPCCYSPWQRQSDVTVMLQWHKNTLENLEFPLFLLNYKKWPDFHTFCWQMRPK